MDGSGDHVGVSQATQVDNTCLENTSTNASSGQTSETGQNAGVRTLGTDQNGPVLRGSDTGQTVESLPDNYNLNAATAS